MSGDVGRVAVDDVAVDDVAVDDVAVGCGDVWGGLIGRVAVDDVAVDVGIIVIGIWNQGFFAASGFIGRL